MQDHVTEMLNAYWAGEEDYGPVTSDPGTRGQPAKRLNSMAAIQEACRHTWSSDPVPSCIKGCGAERDCEMVVQFQENKPMRRHMTHQPREYMRKKTDKLGGLELDLADMRDEFRADLLKCGTWPAVYRVCVEYSVGEHFLCVPAFLGGQVGLLRMMKPINELVYKQGFTVQFMYVAYKLIQLWYPDVERRQWIPLKITKPTLMKAERQWELICAEYGLPCKKTCMNDLKTPW